jgi:hypothetical protein
MNAQLSCSKCGGPLTADLFNRGDLVPCPKCQAELQLEVFPAFDRPLEAAHTAERVVVEGESSCFYHPHKKAVVPCEACGRFLCALCDMHLDGRHLCPSCLETGKKKRTIQSLEDRRTLYNRQALVLSLLPFLISGLAAIYLAVRYWKAPRSLVSPMRWAMPMALVFGILQTLLLVVMIVAIATATH